MWALSARAPASPGRACGSVVARGVGPRPIPRSTSVCAAEGEGSETIEGLPTDAGGRHAPALDGPPGVVAPAVPRAGP